MKAIFVLAVLTFTCQVWANSFDNFSKTGEAPAAPHHIIIKTKTAVSVQSLGFNRSVMAQRPLIQDMQIHLLKLSPVLDIQAVLKELRKHPQVAYAQLDHKLTMRAATGPNDPDFKDQWSMTLTDDNYGIDAVKAWETFGTGGKDANNNDLVVAVVDGGVETTHPDLMDNIWVNELEIAGNGIDDDENGYIDDINGWNGYTDSGELESSYHGTHVAGIVGAKGNNDNQVTGVNWDLKIMNIPGSTGQTSVALTAYNYILNQKKLWLETNGEKGANVVATNSSFGIDYADCTSGTYPAWNDIYTEMGEAGILSAAATMNNPSNVDQTGDVPTGCTSPYLITVTNSNPKGKRAYAAYGIESIDLAAPGEDILSTLTNGGVGYLSGTSMATPHVAGAVAFLSSIASPDYMELSLNDPAMAATVMKNIILDTVTKRDGLADEVVSGGILNLYEAANAIVNFELEDNMEE